MSNSTDLLQDVLNEIDPETTPLSEKKKKGRSGKVLKSPKGDSGATADSDAKSPPPNDKTAKKNTEGSSDQLMDLDDLLDAAQAS